MPRRNFLVLLTAATVSLACYAVATRNRYVTPLTQAMNIVTAEYIDEVDRRALFEGAMVGMLDTLDPYSGYVSPEEFQQFQQAMDGEFEGVGIVIEPTDDGRLKVVDALIGKPAYAAGIRPGDTILAIDGIELNNLPHRDRVRDAVNKIRGQPGTTVKMLVQHARGGKPQTYELLRAKIPLESILGDARARDGTWVYRLVDHPRIGFIRIVSFGERTGDELRQALRSYEQPGEEIDALVIDLRGNAGGLLTAAVETCDMFIDRGLIVSTQGRGGVERHREMATRKTEFPPDIPIVILVDKLSASASEIVAACLQDHERATIAGQRSWGKGTVQNVIYLPVSGEQSALRLTVGRYLRPSGVDIHKRKDAKESDPWGVRPSPELEVHPTNQQYETFTLARRKRDLLTWQGLAAARQERSDTPAHAATSADEAHSEPLEPAADPSAFSANAHGSSDPMDELPPSPLPMAHDSSVVPALPTPPTPIPEPELDAEPQTTPEQAAEANALLDPAAIDPQLHKALEFLRGEIAKRTRKPAKSH